MASAVVTTAKETLFWRIGGKRRAYTQSDIRDAIVRYNGPAPPQRGT
ncbi:hypothetical protein PspLS_07270 [Pyricularia sp. CBS 133598]|nr:hypothetical protein PspLS_07270 [Pyricularia sp. CBS 133598]